MRWSTGRLEAFSDGVLAIVVGFKLRSLMHHPDAPPVQTATPA